MVFNEKTSIYDIHPGINQIWLGDFDDSESEGYLRLEALWSELNSQVDS